MRKAVKMTIEDEGSVSRALHNLKDGEHVDTAAHKLWEHAFSRLIRVARGMLRDIHRGPADEEDIALSAFQSLCAGAARGQYPELESRDNLWRILYTITLRKAAARRGYEKAKRRDAGRIVEVEIDTLAARDPAPEFVTTLVDELRYLMSTLRDDGLRQVARLMLEGLTNQEIADRLDCDVRTIERKRKLIRKAWAREVNP
jgi:DNA-directed RNA polymerase specialized sigma24 family protein